MSSKLTPDLDLQKNAATVKMGVLCWVDGFVR